MINDNCISLKFIETMLSITSDPCTIVLIFLFYIYNTSAVFLTTRNGIYWIKLYDRVNKSLDRIVKGLQKPNINLHLSNFN